jgi:XRE family transcriptional regulator, regulator of sulfur utilization
MTRRDLLVALIAVVLTLTGVAAMQPKPEPLGSQVWDWKDMVAKPNATGEVRTIVRAPTVTLEELEIHITTLKPGVASHAPHQHPNEEMLIVREGTVEALVNGQLKRVGPGSIIFQASNQLHNIKNVGDTPATYHVINWKTAATPKASAPKAQ